MTDQKIDTSELNFIIKADTETFTSSTITHEDHVALTQQYCNHATGLEHIETVKLYYDNFNDFEKPSHYFDCQLPSHHDLPQSSHQDIAPSSDTNRTTDCLNEHLKDSALDQRRQDMENNHISSLHQRHESIYNKENTTKFHDILTIDEFKTAVAAPNVNAYFQRLSCSFVYQLQEKACTFSRKKTLAQLQAKPNFVNAILSGKIAKLLEQIRSADLYTAHTAFIELKQLWPYKHKRSFLNGHSYSSKEKIFLNRIIINVIKIAERELIIRPDYIAQHADARSQAIIQAHRSKCFLLQKQGNRTELFKEIGRLSHGVDRSVRKENFTDKVCLAITIDALSNPITPTLPEPVGYILDTIKHENLTVAHAEIVHLKKQTAEIFLQENLTDPIEQSEFLIKNFGIDVLENTQNTYQDRPDMRNLRTLFNPLDVQNASLRILETNTSYESVCDSFQILTDQVLENAQLCELECLPHIENHILASLHVMRTPKNAAEFVFHTTIVDHLLTDLQCQANAVVAGETPMWDLDRVPALLTRGLVTFITRLNPLTQGKNIASLFVDIALLAKNRVIDIVTDPITTTQNSIATTTSNINFVTDVAHFTSDTTTGLSYLSSQEGQRRLGTFCNNIVEFGKVSDELCASLTAEQVVDFTAELAADFVFMWGAPSVGNYLKKIDAIGTISNEAKMVAQGLKNAVQKHPAFETAEGIVLKMSDEMKDVGNTFKSAHETITDSAFFKKLKSIGDNTWQSPAGLIYKPDKKFGNHINHVLAHAKPNPAKNCHTVFNIPKNEILKLIDEAWLMKGEPLQSDLGAYIIDMKRIIGSDGESAIKIATIPGTSEILTAYPVKL